MILHKAVLRKLAHLSGYLPIVSSTVAAALCSCTLEDPRDLCCPDFCAMTYTYRPYGAEAFTDYITSLRHLLYDAEGAFIGELPPGESLQYQPLNLSEGYYTMVTLGNHGSATSVNHSEATHISELNLACTDDEADELYWGISRFAIDERGRGKLLNSKETSARSTLTTPMNNIHCHLTVHVEWANMPPYIGVYEIELTGVPTGYTLHPEQATTAGGFLVPVHNSSGKHSKRVMLDGLTLDATFTTLRYSDEAIPTLRLLFADEQVGPDIDLGRAFRSWGWHPSEIHVQDYKVNIRLYGDGSAEVSPLIYGSVNDWIDGGTFS